MRETLSNGGQAAKETAETGDSSGDFDKLKGGPDDPARGVGSTVSVQPRSERAA